MINGSDIEDEEQTLIAQGNKEHASVLESSVFGMALLSTVMLCAKTMIIVLNYVAPPIVTTCAKHVVTMGAHGVGQFAMADGTTTMCTLRGESHGLVLPGNMYSLYVCASNLCYTPEYARNNFEPTNWNSWVHFAMVGVFSAVFLFALLPVVGCVHVWLRTMRYRRWYRDAATRYTLLGRCFPPLPVRAANASFPSYQAV